MELKAIIAGLLFGAWPILMQRSHLPGNIQSFVFAGGTFLIVSFFAISGLLFRIIKVFRSKSSKSNDFSLANVFSYISHIFNSRKPFDYNVPLCHT